MELRGAPRAGDITEAQAETILNTVLDARIDYVDTSIERAERGTDRPLYRASGAEYYPASKCGCLVSAPTAHAASVVHMFSRATTSSLVSSKASRAGKPTTWTSSNSISRRPAKPSPSKAH